MAVVRAALGEGAFIRRIGGGVEQRLPWWRTMRVIMTTRRPGDRDDRESAARRPRPKVERPLLPPAPRKFLPVWPAFFAARITSPTKLFGGLTPLLPCWMRPGRMRSSSSRVVIAARPPRNKDDGARDIEMVEELA